MYGAAGLFMHTSRLGLTRLPGNDAASQLCYTITCTCLLRVAVRAGKSQD